jgi:serine/threonine-protein kinase RsbW
MWKSGERMTHNSQATDGPVFTIRLDARADHLMLVRQAIEGAIEPLGADSNLVNDVKLAVTEACSNVVKYAYADEPGPMHITLNRLGPDDIQIIVRDFGKWRDRGTPPPEEISGMGIPLIKSVAADQEISRGDDGTEVSMTFALNGKSEANE